MKLDNMNLQDVIERLANLEIEVRDSQDLDFINQSIEDKKALLIRKQELEELEQRKADAQALANGEVTPDKIIKERGNKMENVEIRDSLEYGKAFVKYALGLSDDSECRSLLTTTVSGTVPVPTMLDDEIKNAWENCELAQLAKFTFYKGNVQVAFEYSATDASEHTEGTDAPDEETLVFGTVDLIAKSIKKWITISDEAIDNTTIDTLGYIYQELAQKIAEKAEELMIAKIDASPATTTQTACGVPTYKASTLSVDTVTMALAELSGKAKNIVLAMNRRTYAALKAVAKKANYNMDVFDGCKVIFSDKIKAYSAASDGETYIIAGDFGYGFQINFPNNHQLTLKLDEISLSEKDLVKVVGREYAGMGVVAPNAFVKVIK